VKEAEGDTQVVEALADILWVELEQGMLELKRAPLRIGEIQSVRGRVE